MRASLDCHKGSSCAIESHLAEDGHLYGVGSNDGVVDVVNMKL